MIHFVYDHLLIISIVFAIIIVISPYLLKLRWFHLSKDRVASLVVTLGIFGTFLGVTLGLLNFNTDRLNESVPELLGGLKTAFITSLAGFAANIVLRIFPFVYGFKKQKIKESENLGEVMIDKLDAIAKVIGGEGESTMLTQLQKIRTNNQDGFNTMKRAFDDFAEKMVADNTQSLIDALTEVMRDFNTKINEQFGENFKQLNEAVGAMLNWQEEYKAQVEQSIVLFKSVSENLSGIDKSLENTANSYQIIYETNKKLEKLIKDFSLEVNSFAELGNKAKESFPIIKENMDSLTKESAKYVEDSLGKLRKNYDDYSTTQKRLMHEYQQNIQEMINSNSQKNKLLDEQLQEELNKALKSLGSQLTSLSQKFVDDYTPLTERLKEVLNIAEQLQLKPDRK